MEDSYRDEQHVGRVGTAFIFFYLIVVVILSIVVLIAVWPAPDGPVIQTQLGRLSIELRYLLLVISSGALGGSLHALTSLVDYVGNRMLMRSWLLWYLYRVFVAVPLALIIYMAIRGMLFSPSANVSDINPFGLAALNCLAGMFSKNATDKLNEVFQTLFGQATKLEKDIDRIGTLLGITSLDNYQGYICMTFQDQQGLSISSDEPPVLRAGNDYQLVTWFQPSKPKNWLKDDIKIEGGVEAKNVEFFLTADSEKVSLIPRQASVSFAIKERSPEVNFKMSVPDNVESFEFWIEVTQKNQLVRVVSKTVSIKQQQRTIP